MRFQFTKKEIIELLVSALVLTMAFAILWRDSVPLLEIVLGVTTGFILHELAHKFVAQHMRYAAEYVMWRMGAIVALVTAFLGFIFAVPGAVQIGPRIDLYGRQVVKKRQVGIIGLAGPMTNVVIALVFMGIGFFYPIMRSAVFINLFLAGFNMIPFGPFDGAKVKNWSWVAWGIAIAAIVLVAIVFSKLI